MGWWRSGADGSSLHMKDTGLTWGDGPADAIDAGMEKLISQLHKEFGRYPTVEELDSCKFDDNIEVHFPEFAMAVQDAVKVFTDDLGRLPTDAELLAGLRFSDSEIALEGYMRSDYAVGDTVRWVVREKDERGFDRVTGMQEGVVEELPQGRVPSTFIPVRLADGTLERVQQMWLDKVLPDDKTLEEAEAEIKRIYGVGL